MRYVRCSRRPTFGCRRERSARWSGTGSPAWTTPRSSGSRTTSSGPGATARPSRCTASPPPAWDERSRSCPQPVRRRSAPRCCSRRSDVPGVDALVAQVLDEATLDVAKAHALGRAREQAIAALLPMLERDDEQGARARDALLFLGSAPAIEHVRSMGWSRHGPRLRRAEARVAFHAAARPARGGGRIRARGSREGAREDRRRARVRAAHRPARGPARPDLRGRRRGARLVRGRARAGGDPGRARRSRRPARPLRAGDRTLDGLRPLSPALARRVRAAIVVRGHENRRSPT